MAYNGLQDFIRTLEQRGELRRVRAPVSAELEITEIADRISKRYGPALLFENVRGAAFPLLINAMGSYERMSLGLGADSLDGIAREIEGYLQLLQRLSPRTVLQNLPRLLRLLCAPPVRTPLRGVCQQVVRREVDLSLLPVLKCWPQDAGRFFTLPLVFTRDPETGRQNVGMYRMQVLDKTTTAMHWHKHKDGSALYRRYRESGKRMPVSVALGCDPAVTYAATAPLPAALDEMLLAGWLRRRNVRMVRCVSNSIWVPAQAEIVLEGYVDPAEEPVLEGPFGDHTGYYSLADYYPRFHVTCITHRRNAVYPATIVGKPPMEDCYMAKATERIFLPLLRMQIPELVDLYLPLEGVFHNCAVLSVRNAYPGCARKVMHSVWGMGQMMYTKLVVVVDEAVDVQQPQQVWEAVFRQVRGAQSLVLSDGPLDALDHSSNRPLYGCRLGVDATAGQAGEPPGASPPAWRVLCVNKERPWQGREAVARCLRSGPHRFVVAVDAGVDPSDLSTVLWKLFNNIDARRDLVLEGEKIGVDATKKWPEEGLTRGWPDDIVMSPDVQELVDKRWGEYGLD